MTATVVDVRVDAGSTIGIGTAALDTGRLVRFAGDHRPMAHIAEALAAGEDVVVDLEAWQILGMVAGNTAFHR